MSEDPRAVLRGLEMRARKRFGQHFLTRAETVDRIVRGARVEAGDAVVEVGPGLGILTRALLRVGARVTAVELDRDLAQHVRETLPEVALVEADATRVRWSEIAPAGAKVVSNLPYNVGTGVLMDMLRSGVFSRITVMLQKEVVDRLMAAPGSKAYGALSVQAAIYGQPVYVMTVEPGAFHPPPKVRSAVVRFDAFERPASGEVSPARLERVVKAAFSQRRKTLVNSMGALYGKEAVREACARAAVDPGLRAEAVDVDGFRRLAAVLEGGPLASGSPRG